VQLIEAGYCAPRPGPSPPINTIFRRVWRMGGAHRTGTANTSQDSIRLLRAALPARTFAYSNADFNNSSLRAPALSDLFPLLPRSLAAAIHDWPAVNSSRILCYNLAFTIASIKVPIKGAKHTSRLGVCS
jgi:hypothetical protein